MATKTYQALKFEQFGNPSDVIKLVELNTPQVGEHQVLLKMRAAAVHPSDFFVVQGVYLRPAPPGVAGAEGVGVVEAVGSQVSDLKVGQRIAFWTESAQTGTWAQYFVLDTKLTRLYTVLPDSISDEVGAQLILNPLTILGMFEEHEEDGLRAGDWLLQTAAASALGRMLIQFAKIKGYKTVNVVRHQKQIDELKSLGADEVILQDNLTADAKRITQGKLRFAVDAVAGSVAGDVVNALDLDGTLLIYGLLSGVEAKFNALTMMITHPSIRGFWITHFLNSRTQKIPTLLKSVVDAVSGGKIDISAKSFSLSQFKEAFAHSQATGKSEKTVFLF